MGATPRWMGYVSVDDVEVTTAALKRLGGTVYVPPTDSNIGRIAVVADPQAATLALVQGLSVRRAQDGRATWSSRTSRAGWLARTVGADPATAFAFYGRAVRLAESGRRD